jgi:hypothetical protein
MCKKEKRRKYQKNQKTKKKAPMRGFKKETAAELEKSQLNSYLEAAPSCSIREEIC